MVAVCLPGGERDRERRRETISKIGEEGEHDRRRVSVQIDQEEADALLTVLLHAAERSTASAALLDRLLVLFADAQRELNRPVTGMPESATDDSALISAR
jgi:hypothetical protein